MEFLKDIFEKVKGCNPPGIPLSLDTNSRLLFVASMILSASLTVSLLCLFKVTSLEDEHHKLRMKIRESEWVEVNNEGVKEAGNGKDTSDLHFKDD